MREFLRLVQADRRFGLAVVLGIVYLFSMAEGLRFIFERSTWATLWASGILAGLLNIGLTLLFLAIGIFLSLMVAPLAYTLLQALEWLFQRPVRVSLAIVVIFLPIFMWNLGRPKEHALQLAILQNEQEEEARALLARQAKEAQEGVQIPGYTEHDPHGTYTEYETEDPVDMQSRHRGEREDLILLHREQLFTLQSLHRSGRSNLLFWLNRDVGKLIPDQLLASQPALVILLGMLCLVIHEVRSRGIF